ncbi:carboxy terminal-processing peptidase [Noviherbaspirillum sp.]|uniref:carboxy terminal-processing peptidase n=1 Tax=Noviherbaspirillum sp. TaxID=1926288 RepID=UPI002B48CD3F|nr:carboxy terminal-processing peptidase [Noviherbaspirillum sp.]HJV79210.1 carboxy terminal-processing peptidase [Noviherbaspirillum sp.]HJW56932.1 carboxy terminal-processing peptidase [Burkholderiaceae bacterium]
MKFKLLFTALLFGVALNAAALQPATAPMLAPSQTQVQTAQITAQLLKRFPYQPAQLDAAMSERIFQHYFKALDPGKYFFLQADIDRFADVRPKLGEEVERGDLRAAFDIFNLYERRVTERLADARDLLKKGFDFTKHESYQFDRDKAQFPQSDEEAHELWRKRVKNDWLQLKLTGKKDATIRATLDKRYGSLASRVSKYKSEDAFQVFLDAFATAVDPHTDYFGVAASSNFDIAMKLSLLGIGAVLQEKDEYTTIRELVPGGPAALSGKLQAGDRIVGVGQDKSGAIIDVVGTRLDEVVDLIRGPKGSTVRLDVLPASAGPDGKHKLVTLVRNKISLEQQAAKKSIIKVDEGGITRQVGVISLPAFYQDFEARHKGDKDFRSTTRDVKRLVEELKQEHVDALLIDLRNNGGGALDEAVALTGVFTGAGPVLQERNAQGQVKVDNSDAPKPVWDGPLGVLINRGSASASEIFAAAIQDYGRGIIIGEQSFGKGTVQSIVSLDQLAQHQKPEFGELKMTIAQFFRINGGTTQLRGVTPDIDFPPISDTEHIGESSYHNALPWTQIEPVGYKPLGDVSSVLSQLKSRHASRIAKDKEFQYLLEDINELKAARAKALVSLNEAERAEERSKRAAQLKLREANSGTGRDGEKADLKGDAATAKPSKQLDTRALDDPDDESVAGESQKDSKDIWLIEAAHIVSDTAQLQSSGQARAVGASAMAR